MNVAAAGPVVWREDDGTFRMAYSAIGTRWGHYSMCYAESDDGIRWRKPELSRPYRVWGYPWVPGIFCLSSLALLANHLVHTPHDLIWLAGFLLAGLPLYAVLHRCASTLDL